MSIETRQKESVDEQEDDGRESSFRAAEAAAAPSSARWQMNRVGILNFWYYDEEEFQLENGRIILRGANGSGKSVTMQSFLPLVLDGDKRAHRLDPFGSRDRRIEYYLLGEEESGSVKTDSTGYLWMEFKHGETGLHRTIGIGLRARRGGAQVQFWGFAITDGRRIGRDLWLYDRPAWLEDKIKTPLDRKELEKLIGAGGQVVHDQKAYQDLVNKQLFGFPDSDAFQDLLQLMIQLRSPKLSKDFKPSAIYQILHQALPPLLEDDLRPLSEVLEDMDQITDRLDELRRHRASVDKLQQRYDFYNKHQLLERSDRYRAAAAELEQALAKVRTCQQELDAAGQDREAAESRLAALQDQVRTLNAERELLGRHEAIGKQQEYEKAQEMLEDLERQLARARESLRKAGAREDQLRREQEARQADLQRLGGGQLELLDELEALAGELEFQEHAVYHRYWMPDVPAGDAWREPWRRDLRQHRQRIEQALARAIQEREAGAAARDREIELGEASRSRDEAERIRGDRGRKLDEAREELRNELAIWAGRLQVLPFDEASLRAALEAVSEYSEESSSLEPLRAPLAAAYDGERERLVSARLELERESRQLAADREQLVMEKRRWEQSREPEPPRSEARSRFRSRLAGEIAGAPLYAACDFALGLTEEARARIEEALEKSGLLDAWIAPDGRIEAAAAGEEESWLAPVPYEFGYTLADVLVADPPEGGGLSAERIRQVLRSFLWDESGAAGDGDWGGAIGADGSYRLGPLSGRSAVKERAEYIGRETRKRTRLLEIARLQQEISELDGQLAAAAARLAAAAEAESRLAQERDAYPSPSMMEAARKELEAAGHRLAAALHQEQRALERFKAKAEEWHRLQRELAEATADWSRLKREPELAAALRSAADYEAQLSELASLWKEHEGTARALERLSEEIASAGQEREDLLQLEDELDLRRRDQQAQTDALKRLIEELGLADVSRRLEELRQQLQALFRSVRDEEAAVDRAKGEAARADARLVLLREQQQEREHAARQTSGQLEQEMELGLAGDWKSQLHQARAAGKPALGRLAAEVRSEYAGLFENRNVDNITNRLLEEMSAARTQLTDYVLELAVDERSGRFMVWSMRNPQQPLAPQRLLQELEELEAEQDALLSEKDRVLFEDIILSSVGKAIRQRIHRAEQWVREMNRLMEARETSSGLRLRLEWGPKSAATEEQLDVHDLVELLKRDSQRLREDEIEAMIRHFREQIRLAKETAQNEQESLRLHLYRILDYRNWFEFGLKSKKGTQAAYRPLTDARFNVLSGGEKAMAMYIPLFAAAWSRYSDAREDAPRLISLDEAFAGVDEENMRDMFKLLTDMGFDFMMTSQVLWGCYDTVPQLAIYEISRPKDVDFVTLFHYRWNGKRRTYVEADEPS